MNTRIAMALLILTAAHWAPDSQAAACTGASSFSDVPQGASYCTNVQWLANRQITLGCGGGNYCPNDAVNRASMALFMNRLADAIVQPAVNIQSAVGAYTLTSLAVANIQCEGNALAAVPYPRSITLSTHLSAKTVSGQATLGIQPTYSTDGGANWDFPNTNAEMVGFDATYVGNVSSPATFTLPANLPLRVGVGAYSVAGATSIAAGGRCHVLVRSQSLTGSSAPYDLPVDSGIPDGF